MSRFNSSILAITRCARQFRGDAMAPYGLKSCHTGYLARICSEPGISQDQLAKKMLTDKSNVARQAAALEEAGFITRRPSSCDKRALELHPTEKALALLPQIRQIIDQWDDILSQGMTEEELDTVTRLLEKMRQNAAQWMEER